MTLKAKRVGALLVKETLECAVKEREVDNLWGRKEGVGGTLKNGLSNSWSAVTPRPEARLSDEQDKCLQSGVPGQQGVSEGRTWQSMSVWSEQQERGRFPRPQVDQTREHSDKTQMCEEILEDGLKKWVGDFKISAQEVLMKDSIGDVQRFPTSSLEEPCNWEVPIGTEDLLRSEGHMFAGSLVGNSVADVPPARASNTVRAPDGGAEESLEQDMKRGEALREILEATAHASNLGVSSESSDKFPAEGDQKRQGERPGKSLSFAESRSISTELPEGMSSQWVLSADASQMKTEELKENLSSARGPLLERPRGDIGHRQSPGVGVVILDDDEEEEEEDDEHCTDADMDSDAGSLRPFRRPARGQTAGPAMPAVRESSNGKSESSSSGEDSDDDDCQILGWRPAQRNQDTTEADVRAPSWIGRNQSASAHRHENSQGTHRKSDSSDIEVMRDSQGDIRQLWEEAALMRRMGRVESEGSKASGDGGRGQASNLVKRNAVQGSRRREQRVPRREMGPRGQTILLESVATSTDSDSPTTAAEENGWVKTGGEAAACGRPKDERVAHVGSTVARVYESSSVLFTTSEGFDEISVEVPIASNVMGVQEANKGKDESFKSDKLSGWMSKKVEERGYFHRVDEASTSRQYEYSGVSGSADIGDVDVKEGGGKKAGIERIAGQSLLGQREKMKQTAEFQHANEEEWASRQLELERQAQEVQKLRKRRKAQADRRMEMQSRQKKRLQEMRQSQQKEEWNLELREELRGQVRSDLERLALGCNDMASLLRRLGIFVEGAAFATVQQVNSAYKQALLRFHPDRASAFAQGDPWRQVEAEETFKLISRMKNTLSLAACPLFSPV